MYVPAHFRETRPEVLHEFMRRHPLATLVARTATGVDANHIPMELAFVDGLPRLRGHVARANPLWREAMPEEPVLAIFTSAGSYVTPSWYPSKREHGKVVPTWNYAAVHARGPIRFVDDAAWLRALVGFEIEVRELVGKFKASQNREERDRAGVAAGLSAQGVSAEEADELVRR